MTKKEDDVSKTDKSGLDLNFCVGQPLEFISRGRFIGPEGWIHHERIIDSWELIMGLGGLVWLQEESRQYALGPDDILFFRPGLTHRGFKPSKAGASFYWVHFRPRANLCLPVVPDRDIRVHLPEWLPGLHLDKARVLMSQLQDAPAAPHSNMNVCDYLCTSLILEIQRTWREQEHPIPGIAAQADVWFTRLLAWAQMNLDNHLQVQDLARHAGKHPDYLAHAFKKHLGMTPLAWLHGLRLNAAKKLLMETSSPVKQIAWQTGFGDARQFSKAFRKAEALTPSQWRRTYSRVSFNRE